MFNAQFSMLKLKGKGDVSILAVLFTFHFSRLTIEHSFSQKEKETFYKLTNQLFNKPNPSFVA